MTYAKNFADRYHAIPGGKARKRPRAPCYICFNVVKGNARYCSPCSVDVNDAYREYRRPDIAAKAKAKRAAQKAAKA